VLAPEVAVAMCVCGSDRLDYLTQAVESITRQNFNNLVLIVYADGALPADIQNYLLSVQSDRLLLLQGHERRGLPHGLNVIIEEVLARMPGVKYIARMDADDIATPDRLLTQFEHMEAHQEIDVLGAWCIEFDDKGSEFLKRMPGGAQLARFSCYRSPLVHPTAFVRRRPFEAGYRYRVDLLKAQDYDLWSRLMVDGYAFDNLQIPLLRYRVSAQMHQRRAGLGLVWRETRMRFKHAWLMGIYSPVVWLKIVAFFAVRMSPPSFRVVFYKHLRG
jgi:glycosyltransferase involved in cell wall biosynthesis